MEVLQGKEEEHVNQEGNYAKPWGTWDHPHPSDIAEGRFCEEEEALCAIAVPNKGSAIQKGTYSGFIHVLLDNL